MPQIAVRVRRLENQSIRKQRFFVAKSKADADACLLWIAKNCPHWPVGSYVVIYDEMPPREGSEHCLDQPWVRW